MKAHPLAHEYAWIMREGKFIILNMPTRHVRIGSISILFTLPLHNRCTTGDPSLFVKSKNEWRMEVWTGALWFTWKRLNL